MASILDSKTKDGVKFGKELREKEFLLDPKYRNLNHGSFGTHPRAIQRTLRQYQDAAEQRPDTFIRYTYPKLLDASRAAIASHLHCPTSTVVFVPNASTGVNTVLRNLSFDDKSHILYFSTIYNACEKTVAYVTETTPAKAVKIDVTYPIEDDVLVARFRAAVQGVRAAGGEVSVAVFDTVVSMPGVRVPFEELVKVCKELGVLSCVDAAHAVGHLPLKLGEGEGSLDCDFFVSNLHKWLFVPRGCAIFYVPLRNQHLIRSTIPTSHGFIPRSFSIATPFAKSTKSTFETNFEFVGTIDNAPYLSVSDALKWRESIGGEDVIMEYCETLAAEGSKLVADALGTEVLGNSTGTCFGNVRLPLDMDEIKAYAVKSGVDEAQVAGTVRDWIGKTLVDEYDGFIAIVPHGGAWWVRLSGQVYLEMEDFEWAAKTLKEVSERVKKGEWISG